MIVLTGFEMPLLVRGTTEEEKTKATIEAIKKIITDNKGETGDIEEWGKKNLHYPIAKETSAFYFFLNFEADKKTIPAIDKKLKLEENLLRYLLLKKEEVKKSKERKGKSEAKKEAITIIR